MKPLRLRGKRLIDVFAPGAGIGVLVNIPCLLGYCWPAYPGLALARTVNGGSNAAFLLLVALGNAVFYGMLGCVGYYMFTGRKSPRQTWNEVPECVVCGFRWPMPTDPRCPQCKQADSFAVHLADKSAIPTCTSCGYDLQGCTSPRCPECGVVI